MNEHGFLEIGTEKKNKDQVSYSKFGPEEITDQQCAMKACKEYDWVRNSEAKGFRGLIGDYPPSRGYKFELTGNPTANSKKIDILKSQNWIDHDTRALQIMMNFFSVWTNTYYYVELNIELPYSDDQVIYKNMRTSNLFFYKGIGNERFKSSI